MVAAPYAYRQLCRVRRTVELTGCRNDSILPSVKSYAYWDTYRYTHSNALSYPNANATTW